MEQRQPARAPERSNKVQRHEVAADRHKLASLLL
jgi:hypothetical protein